MVKATSSIVYNYQCMRCAATSQSASLPGASECPNGGLHEWRKLSQVGTLPFQCKKCGATVPSKIIPSSTSCPLGGFHLWKQLGGGGR